jgi:cytochrome P450
MQVLFEGGTDTSSLVVEYAMAELMRNPGTMRKLRADVRMAIPQGKDIVTEDDVNGVTMPYLKAVIKETFRLHAPGPLLIPHFSMADCHIGGYTVPSGTRTLVNNWALGRDPSYWERANDFIPERFGSGRRICPGINLAISTIEVMLANLVYHFNWKLPPELVERGIDMTQSFGLTLHRTEKLILVPVPPQN